MHGAKRKAHELGLMGKAVKDFCEELHCLHYTAVMEGMSMQGMEIRRELEVMPPDKRFGNELCHATGYQECHGNPADPADWWNEYEDADGELHYGR